MTSLQLPHPQLKNRYWQASCGFIFPVLPSLSLPLFSSQMAGPTAGWNKMVILGDLKISMSLYVLKLGYSMSREWRLFSLSLTPLLGIKSEAVCSESSAVQVLTLHSTGPPNPVTATPTVYHSERHPAPSMAHYHVAFHFFLITLFLCSSKVEDKLFNKSPGVNFMST